MIHHYQNAPLLTSLHHYQVLSHHLWFLQNQSLKIENHHQYQLATQKTKRQKIRDKHKNERHGASTTIQFLTL